MFNTKTPWSVLVHAKLEQTDRDETKLEEGNNTNTTDS